MDRKALVVALALCAWPLSAHAVTQDNFLLRTAQDLVALCSADESDPLHTAAISFCHGYLLGTVQYDLELVRTRVHAPFVCFPSPPPPRAETVQRFVTWARAHPEYMGENPVETWFKFLTDTWPCRR